MAMLDKGASGTMHLQWVRQISATMKAHREHNYRLSATLSQALGRELEGLAPLEVRLGGSVDAFRKYIEGARTNVRAKQRVADYLVDLAQSETRASVTLAKAEVDKVLPGGAVSIWAGRPLSRILNAGRLATVKAGHEAAAKLRTLPAKEVFAFVETSASALEKASDLLDGFVTEDVKEIEPKRVPLRSAMEGDIYALRDFLTKMNGRLLQDASQDFIDSLYPALRRDNKSLAEPLDEELDTDVTTPEPSPAPTP